MVHKQVKIRGGLHFASDIFVCYIPSKKMHDSAENITSNHGDIEHRILWDPVEKPS